MEGNGSLAILTADVFQNAQIDAVDVSPQALEVAKINLNNLIESTRFNLNQYSNELVVIESL